jgi:hypothetical protein
LGLEANCKLRLGKKISAGKALLETNELIFRGGEPLVIPLKEIESADAKRGELHVKFSGGTAVLELGRDAEKWALKIRYPRSRIDKLGVKPESRVAVLGIRDDEFRQELAARAPEVAEGKPKKDSDIVFLSVEDQKTLEQLKPLSAYLKSNGTIWVIYPKGQKHITQNDVMVAAKKAGLVDVKIVSFSDTHSALKLVIPVARRKGAG